MSEVTAPMLKVDFHAGRGLERGKYVTLDDLSRNFALNPRSGVKCKAYHRDKPNAARDAELPALAAYLAHVARASKGLSAFDHGKWRDVWKKIREAG